MLPVTKFPIIIIATPRTGSTALCEIINKLFNYVTGWRCFDEPLYPSVNWGEFYRFSKKSNNYVLKFMALEYQTLPKHVKAKIESKNCTLIFLKRKDTIAQCTSNYIANVTNLWRNLKDDPKSTNNEIPYDLSLVMQSITEIFEQVKALNALSYSPTYIFNMEDLNLKQDKFLPTKKPKNYNEIYDRIYGLAGNKKRIKHFFGVDL